MNPDDHMLPPSIPPSLAQSRVEELRGLEGLAAREIPSHFALSLNELRAQAQAQPSVTAHTEPVIADPEPEESTHEPLVYPVSTWADVPTFEALIPRIAEQLERIAESDSPIARATLLGLARRLSSIEVGDPALNLASQRRAEGKRWRDIAEELNARVEGGEARFAPPRGERWTEASLRRATARGAR